MTKDWVGLRKTLHISAGEYSEPFILESDTFQVPPYYTQQPAFTVTLLGDNDAGVIVPTNEVTMTLDESNTLWTAVPPDPQNSAYLELLKSIVPSDWSQNDPTAKDYVRNRTHWEDETINRVLVPKTLVNNDTRTVPLNFEVNQPFEAVVIWNGVEYTEKFKHSADSGVPRLFNGLSYWYLGEDNPDSTLPFIAVSPYGNMAAVLFSGDEAELSITVKGPEVHYINPKYIKDFYFSEKVLHDYPVTMELWWDITMGGESPIIPLIKVAGVQYEGLSPSKVDGIDYYYTAGEYTLQFHAAEGEEYRWYTCTPKAEAFFSSGVLKLPRFPLSIYQ